MVAQHIVMWRLQQDHWQNLNASSRCNPCKLITMKLGFGCLPHFRVSNGLVGCTLLLISTSTNGSLKSYHNNNSKANPELSKSCDDWILVLVPARSISPVKGEIDFVYDIESIRLLLLSLDSANYSNNNIDIRVILGAYSNEYESCHRYETTSKCLKA